MLNLEYKLKVRNKEKFRVNRRKNVLMGESVNDIEADETAYKEIRACRHLKIENIEYICPICKKDFKTRQGANVHIDKMHPEYRTLLNRKG